MDAFKFAFETTIVGLLAFPWLVVMVSIFVPNLRLRDGASALSVPKHLEPAVLTVFILAAAYFMGSAVSPLATQFLDDPDTPGFTIHGIRANMYVRYAGWLTRKPSVDLLTGPLYSAATELPGKCKVDNAASKLRAQTMQDCWKPADDVFLLQEQSVLKMGSDKIDRESRLFERVIVLRGAVFNGFAFFVLSCFAYFARESNQPIHYMWSNRKMIVATVMLIGMAVALIYFAWKWAHGDVHGDPSDPPIMETGLLILGIIGVFTLFKGVAKRSALSSLVVSFILTILAYGSWVWTEFLYAKNVMGAFFAS